MPVYGTPSLRLRHPPYDLLLCDWYCGAAKGIVPGAGLRCSRYLRQRARLWQTISREAREGGAGGRTRRDEGYNDAEHYGESGDAEERTLSIELSDYEYERNEAYAEVMARLINQAREVVDFRRNYLNGEVLTPDEAYAFIESSAAPYFPPEAFRAWGIPTRSHKIELLAESYSDPFNAGIDYNVTLHVTPPGVTKTVRYAPNNTPAPYGRKVDWQYNRMSESLESGGSHERVVPLQALSYRGPDGLRKRKHVWPSSLLDELRRCSI
jgi:hypothetical protein